MIRQKPLLFPFTERKRPSYAHCNEEQWKQWQCTSLQLSPEEETVGTFCTPDVANLSGALFEIVLMLSTSRWGAGNRLFIYE